MKVYMDKITSRLCNPILPLTYDDSLSYLEIMEKLRYKVNELIDYFNGQDAFATETWVLEQIAACKAELEARLDEMDALIDTKLDKATFETFVAELQISINSMAGQIRSLEEATAQNAADIIETYNSLKRYIDDQLIDLEVINPLTGNIQPIQLVLNYMADLLRADSLTAQEYDAAELTAAAYDALQLTAYVYDNYGKNYIGN